MKKQTFTTLRWLNAYAFIAMVVINVLAILLPINGITTGQAADAWPNLFVPAGLTFSIWSVIYILLLLFIVANLIWFQKAEYAESTKRIGYLFILSCAFNIGWIFSWHYQQIALSLILMLSLYVVLALIYRRVIKNPYRFREKLFLQIPFSVYFGWLTIALIANVSVLLVSLGWHGSGLSESLWTILTMALGVLIGAVVIRRNHDLAYALVLAWAYLGIFLKHQNADGFNMAYPLVMWAALACSVILLAIGFLSSQQKNT